MAKESSFKNMVLTLLVITLVSSAILGVVYSMTKDTIALGQVKKVNSAIAQVVPKFDNSPSDEVIKKVVDGDTLRLYPAKKDGQLVGMAIETFTKSGFSGLITLMVGFLPDGTINDITVISQNETPGLGDKIEKSKSNFSVQFQGKNPETFKMTVRKDGGEVDAITASTISSRAFCDAVNRAYLAFKEEVKGEKVDWDAASGASSSAKKSADKNEDAKSDGTSGATSKADTTKYTKIDGTSGATSSAKKSEEKKESVKTDATSGATKSANTVKQSKTDAMSGATSSTKKSEEKKEVVKTDATSGATKKADTTKQSKTDATSGATNNKGGKQ